MIHMKNKQKQTKKKKTNKQGILKRKKKRTKGLIKRQKDNEKSEHFFNFFFLSNINSCHELFFCFLLLFVGIWALVIEQTWPSIMRLITLTRIMSNLIAGALLLRFWFPVCLLFSLFWFLRLCSVRQTPMTPVPSALPPLLILCLWASWAELEAWTQMNIQPGLLTLRDVLQKPSWCTPPTPHSSPLSLCATHSWSRKPPQLYTLFCFVVVGFFFLMSSFPGKPEPGSDSVALWWREKAHKSQSLEWKTQGPENHGAIINGVHYAFNLLSFHFFILFLYLFFLIMFDCLFYSWDSHTPLQRWTGNHVSSTFFFKL